MEIAVLQPTAAANRVVLNVGLLSANLNVVKILCNFQRAFTVNTEAVPALSLFLYWSSRLLWLFDDNVCLPEWPTIKNNGQNASHFNMEIAVLSFSLQCRPTFHETLEKNMHGWTLTYLSTCPSDKEVTENVVV